MTKGLSLAVLVLLATSASGAVTLEPLRNRHLKGTPKYFEQIDFMQTAVESVKSYMDSSLPLGKMSTGTGDHVWQYLSGKSQVGDFVACQTCWYGAQEASSLLSNNAIKQSIESNVITFCSKYIGWSSCSAFVKSFADLIIDNFISLNLQPDYLCTEVIELCPSYNSGYVKLNETTFQD